MPPCNTLQTICCRNPGCAHNRPVLAYTCGRRLYLVVQSGAQVEIAMAVVNLRCGCGWRTVWRCAVKPLTASLEVAA